jgi:UDP-glucuronate 4-epimerase
MSNSQRNVLVTGGAGFIGSHLVERLLADGDRVTVLDNFNEFYNPSVKRDNITAALSNSAYSLVEGDLRDEATLRRLFDQHGPFDIVVHLAAMAGVRPSLENPALYADVNVLGTQRLLDAMHQSNPKGRLVFGSSSSVYGVRSGECFLETDRVDQPLSPYAASKAANEIQCYAAHHTRGLPVICLRFFTVFGPRQRPDLAIHKFFKAIESGTTIDVYGDGSSKRDYTFIADIVGGITSAMTVDFSGYEIINLGRSEPVYLMDMIGAIEKALGKKAKIQHKPFQTGDMPYTYAGIEKARKLLGYEPSTNFQDGIDKFAAWFKAKHSAVSTTASQ